MIKPSVRSPDSANGSLREPIDIVLDALRAAQCEPVKQRNGWKSKCPRHADTKPSLDVAVGDDGKVMLICRSQGCAFDQIAAALGLEPRDFFRHPLSGQAKSKTKSRASQPKVSREKPEKTPSKPHPSPEAAIASTIKRYGPPSKHWVYPDPDGFELMRVYRWDPKEGDKEYRPVHPSADGLRLGDPPGKLPLYHLDEIAKAQVVVVTEGEKCADLARGLGLTATTASHGVNSAYLTDWSPLAGKLVIILPDHENGERYANDAGEILAALEPKPEIRILRLPLGEKGDDIEQWLESLSDSWTPEDCRGELERLWRTAPIWLPPPIEPPRPAVAVDENGFNLTEWGNAQRLIRTYGDRLRYCHSRNVWLAWDGRRWDPAKKGSIWEWTKETVRQLAIEASETEDNDLSVRTYRSALCSTAQEDHGGHHRPRLVRARDWRRGGRLRPRSLAAQLSQRHGRPADRTTARPPPRGSRVQANALRLRPRRALPALVGGIETDLRRR